MFGCNILETTLKNSNIDHLYHNLQKNVLDFSRKKSSDKIGSSVFLVNNFASHFAAAFFPNEADFTVGTLSDDLSHFVPQFA